MPQSPHGWQDSCSGYLESQDDGYQGLVRKMILAALQLRMLKTRAASYQNSVNLTKT